MNPNFNFKNATYHHLWEPQIINIISKLSFDPYEIIDDIIHEAKSKIEPQDDNLSRNEYKTQISQMAESLASYYDFMFTNVPNEDFTWIIYMDDLIEDLF